MDGSNCKNCKICKLCRKLTKQSETQYCNCECFCKSKNKMKDWFPKHTFVYDNLRKDSDPSHSDNSADTIKEPREYNY